MQVELDSGNLNGLTLGATDREENGLNLNFPWVHYWNGTETAFHQDNGTESPGGRRMLFLGPRANAPNPFTLDGRRLLLNAVAWMGTKPDTRSDAPLKAPGVLVTVAADSGPGSLRQAIADADSGATITFSENLSGQTITLNESPFVIDRSLTIDASGLENGLEFSASSQRHFLVNGSGDLTVDGMRFTNGAPASGNGGSILIDGGKVLLRRSVFENNRATERGGAITMFGSGASLRMEECLFTGNQTSADVGGAIMVHAGDLSAFNCTFTGNQAEGGSAIWIEGSGKLLLHHVTITGNTGYPAVQSFVPATIVNSIITANPDGNIGGPSLTFEGNNLLSGSPRLAPLANYGGPTPTMPPLPDSPAIDAGGATALTTDQRGLPRVVGQAPDIGAVEFQGTPDLALFWNTDWDGDGRPFGLEFATGTDSGSGLAAPVPLPSGGVSLGFPFNPQAVGFARWTLESSPDLSPGSWVPLFRSTDPEDFSTWEFPDGISVTLDSGSGTVTIDDERSADRAFYRLTVEPAP